MPDQRMTGLFGLSPSTADVRDILSTIPVRKGGVLPLTEYGDGTSRLDWTAGIPGSLWDAFTAPARAYRGEIPEDQMIPEGLNFAGSVALGSAAVPRPTNAAGMFAGEVEARTVQKRMDLTPEERRARPPWLDYDVPEADQIVRFGGSRPQMSVPEVPGTLLAANPETSAAPGLGLMAAAKQEPKGFIAYHGSPHDFDRFDTSRIGTGEGVQAYGHGLYAADSPAVADSYRGAGNRGEWNYDPSIKRTLAEQEALSWLGSPAAQGTTNIRDLPQLARFGREPDLPWIKALDDLIARGEISRPGRLYQVRINADPETFLDWDKPLSQQKNADAVKSVAGDLWPDIQNAKVQSLLDVFADDRPGTMQALRDAGIPGIKYLDQGSRAAGNGSRNYVVFDDKLIDILKKYGLFGSLGMGAASMMSGGEANAAPAPKASPLWALQPGVF